REKLALTPSG
ncbi:dnaK-like domain protein, partial [Vibrio parahaemolyticus VP2007-007]